MIVRRVQRRANRKAARAPNQHTIRGREAEPPRPSIATPVGGLAVLPLGGKRERKDVGWAVVPKAAGMRFAAEGQDCAEVQDLHLRPVPVNGAAEVRTEGASYYHAVLQQGLRQARLDTRSQDDVREAERAPLPPPCRMATELNGRPALVARLEEPLQVGRFLNGLADGSTPRGNREGQRVRVMQREVTFEAEEVEHKLEARPRVNLPREAHGSAERCAELSVALRRAELREQCGIGLWRAEDRRDGGTETKRRELCASDSGENEEARAKGTHTARNKPGLEAPAAGEVRRPELPTSQTAGNRAKGRLDHVICPTIDEDLASDRVFGQGQALVDDRVFGQGQAFDRDRGRKQVTGLHRGVKPSVLVLRLPPGEDAPPQGPLQASHIALGDGLWPDSTRLFLVC